MKIIFQTLIFAAIAGIFLSCNETTIRREYPILETLEVTNISTRGAKLNAEIIANNNYEIINYGFVWQKNGNSPKINGISNQINFSGNLQSDAFSAEIDEMLFKDTIYYSRAYVETIDFIVYAAPVSFTIN